MREIITKHARSDPFEAMPMYLIDLVMMHLTVEEALEASKVSRQWYEKTSLMHSLMARIKVVTDCGNAGTVKRKDDQNKCCYSHVNFHTVRSLSDSIRLYQTLKVSRCSNCVASAHHFLTVSGSSNREWRHLEFIKCTLKSVHHIILCLRNVNDTLETLTFDRVSSESIGEQPHAEMTLPHLRVLKITQSSQLLLHTFIHVRRLREFSFNGPVLTRRSFSSLCEILNNNPSLKSLSLGGNLTKQLMERFRTTPVAERFHFKLKKIKVAFNSAPEYKELSETVLQFLELHRNTLTSVSFSSTVEFELVSKVFEFPGLTHLTLASKLSVDPKVFKLKTNRKLQRLSIFGIKNYGMIQSFIDSAPNIRSLEVFKINDFLITHLTHTNGKLLHLTVKECDLQPRTIMERNVVPNLLSLNIEWYKKHVASMILHRNERHTNFQQLYCALPFRKKTNKNT